MSSQSPISQSKHSASKHSASPKRSFRKRSRSPKRITRHKTRSSTYKHLYHRKSKGKVRRIPTVLESGLIASRLASSIRDALDIKPLYESTEFCKKRYIGCDNPLCTYAHSVPAARWTEEYADQMANKMLYYKRPVGSSTVGFASRLSKPLSDASHYPRMMVRFSNDEDDDDLEIPSLSGLQVEELEKKWLDRKEQVAHDHWVQRLMGRPKLSKPKEKRRVTLLQKLRHLSRVRPGSVVHMQDMEFDDEMALE